MPEQSTPLPFDETSGSVWLDIYEKQLHEERGTKDSLERRGAWIVTGSLGLSVGLIGISPEADSVSGGFFVAALAAVALLVLAALMGIRVNAPTSYGEAQVADLRGRINEDSFQRPKAVAAQAAAGMWLDILERARKQNAVKAGWLKRAVWLEGAALAATTVALGFQFLS